MLICSIPAQSSLIRLNLMVVAAVALAGCNDKPGSAVVVRERHPAPSVQVQFDAAVAGFLPRTAPDPMPAAESPTELLAATLKELADVRALHPIGGAATASAGGPIRTSRRELTYVLVSPLVVDHKGAVVEGTVEVVDDTDPGEMTFMVFEFGAGSDVLVRSGAGEIKRIAWSALALHTAMLGR